MTRKNALKILQIKIEKPTKEEILLSFKKLVQKHHTVKHKNDNNFDNLFILITNAKEILLQNKKLEKVKSRFKSWCCKCKITIQLTEHQYYKERETMRRILW